MTVPLDPREAGRLPLVLASVVSELAHEFDVEVLLGHILQAAAGLVEADFVALGLAESRTPSVPGVLAARSGSIRLQQVVHTGLSDQQLAEIGRMPAGQGLMGAPLREGRPVRLASAAAEMAGQLPSGHPEVGPYLAVPVAVDGERPGTSEIVGAFYLGRGPGSTPFSEGDERTVTALATAAAVVLDRERLRRRALARQAWLDAGDRLTESLLEAVASDPQAEPGRAGGPDDTLLSTVAQMALDLAGADAVFVAAEGPAQSPVIVVTAGEVAHADEFRSLDLRRSIVAETMRTRKPLVVADLENHPFRLRPPPEMRLPPLGSCVAVPLETPDGTGAVLLIIWSPDHVQAFRDLDPELPRRFADQVALVLQVHGVLRDSRLLAVHEERDRIARDLHDVAIQRLFAVGMSAERASRRVEDPDVRARLDEVVDGIDETITTIRQTIAALQAASQDGFQQAIAQVVDRAARVLPSRPVVSVQGPVRSGVSDAVAAQLLPALEECLSNVVRHSGAHTVRVEVAVTRDVTLTVRDDGHGIREDRRGNGLTNLAARAQRLGGECLVESSAEGTIVTWRVPVQ